MPLCCSLPEAEMPMKERSVGAMSEVELRVVRARATLFVEGLSLL
jgi:hypothetical protein